MKNNENLKKLILLFILIITLLLSIFISINIVEYKEYNKNYNYKIQSIMNEIIDKYPDIEEKDLLSILNSNNDKNILKKYSINLEEDTVINTNNKSLKKYLIINIMFYLITIFLILLYFLRFNSKKDKEINKITKCIEEINKKNYQLNIDDISEGKLSILKNEIYKTTITLKESAENSNKEKLELKKSLSDISHQLKTPLTSILIILDNLIDEPNMDKDTREEFIKDIRRELNNINFLVQSILKLSKFDTNTIEFIEEETKIDKIINESIKNTSMLSDLKNVEVNVNYKDNPIIKCDSKWQIEAISNIIKNCIEHSTKVNIIIEDNKIYTKISIIDNGKGISKEDLPHIFERFYKGKNSSNDSIGIGLSLSKSIIEKDNGKINVISSKKGTTFTIKYFK